MPEARSKMCHDCAFLPDSREREPGSAPCQYEGASVIQVKIMQLACFVAGDERERPFFCHQTVPVVDGRYVPESLNPDGTPVDVPLCAGYAAERARLEAAFREGGRDGLEWAALRGLIERGVTVEGEEAVRA